MPSIAQKERHELRLLTGIMLILSFAAVWNGMRMGQGSWSGRILTIRSLADSFWPLSIGIMALIIGFRQGRAESTPDQIAMHMHRPWSRSYLTARKFQAGWGSLVIAFVLPFICAAVWQHAFTPVPLSAPLLILPGLALMNTVACHATGIYAGVRSGAWYGMRAVPALAALLMSEVPQFSWGLEQIWVLDLLIRGSAIVLISGLLVCIAWKRLLTQGDDDTNPQTSDHILSGILCCIIGWSCIETMRFSDLWLLRQISYDSLRYGLNGGVAVQHTSNNMKHLRLTTFRPFDENLDIDRLTAASARLDHDKSWEFPASEFSYTRPNTRFGPALDLSTIVFNNDLVDAPFARCCVYALPCSGVLTTSPMPGTGPSVTDQAGQPLPDKVDYAAVQVLPYYAGFVFGATCLFVCESDGRPWWWLSTEPYPVRVNGSWDQGTPIRMSYSDEDPAVPPQIIVVTKSGAHTYALDGKELDVLTVPGGLGNTVSGTFIRRQDGSLLVIGTLAQPGSPVLFRHIAANGHALSSRVVTVHDQIEWLRSPMWYAACGFLPLVSVPLITDTHGWFFEATRNAVHPTLWPSVVSAMMMILCVLWVARRRRLAASEARWWYLWTLAFGPAALVAMLLIVRPRPAQRCASCHGWRDIALTTCPHCGATWPMPFDSSRMILDPAA